MKKFKYTYKYIYKNGIIIDVVQNKQKKDKLGKAILVWVCVLFTANTFKYLAEPLKVEVSYTTPVVKQVLGAKVKKEEPKEEISELAKKYPNPKVADYIIKKFGDNHKVALAVALAENRSMRCDATNLNTDGSFDKGIFQINSIHTKRFGDASDCFRNVDIAYAIFTEQGWNPWVAYWTGSYEKFL